MLNYKKNFTLTNITKNYKKYQPPHDIVAGTGPPHFYWPPYAMPHCIMAQSIY